ncbi:Disease resistance protein [Melia azedarach]|uniref:Disease resistance protein n=1 Tax=Melia azedarach TaxID=155640 RepID=A0ACC1YES2_MELAZ|nr:Disease resistance protein [Melia azedarach]
MAEIILTIAIEVVKCVAKCLAPSAGRRIGYLREYKSNHEMLKREVEKLRGKRMSIQRQVVAAKNKVEEVEENVQNWLEKAEEIEENVQKWLDTATKNMPNEDAAAAGRTREDEEENAGNVRENEQTAAKKRWFKMLSPGWKTRYQLGKEAVMQREAVVKHLEVGEFDQISHPIIPKDPRLCIKDFETFESRASTFTNVVSSLSDPDVNIVGIYGMGGIGKTTLAKQVANHLQTNKLFDSVVFVEIAQNPNITKIQKEIGEKLGLPLSQEESESTRAGKLCQRLKNEKSILIILDNIWDHLDLQAVGIPRTDEAKGCKLLLTARIVDVLLSKCNFPLGFLSDEEAWNLFKMMSCRDYDEGSKLKSVARKVANKCAHLPILIVTVARALSNKPLYVWEDFLQQMGMSFSRDVRGIHASIELSYKYLENEVLQKTLLLIRYANLTSTDELLMYGMSLGLFDDIKEMEGRRARVQTLVQQLKDSCLLLDGNTTGKDFSMHDVVRDVVLQIASRDLHAFTNEQVAELEWGDENTLKAYHSIVLKEVKMGDLPPVSECQQLKLLSLSAAGSALTIQDDFFTRMTKLRVLVLANMHLPSQPKSIHFLSNLQALGLYNCKLDDTAILGELKKLEILSLRNSRIKQLSAEVCHLIRLKSLDLRAQYAKFSFGVNIIPPNVISSLSNLEELYMSEFQWEKEGLNERRKNASLDELKHLSKLKRLEIQIPDANTLPRDLSFETLEWYKIDIKGLDDNGRALDGDRFWSFTMHSSCRKIRLVAINNNICLNDGHIMQLKGIEDLCLVRLKDMKSDLYELDRDGFQQLKYLQVRDSINLSCIVDSMKYVTPNVFPILESLLIKNLVNLEKICRGQIIAESSFSQLRKINVRECHKLDNIFPLLIARKLQLLESIDVIDCKNMEQIFVIERADESNSGSEVTDNINLCQLRSLKLNSLPQLKGLCSKSKAPRTLHQKGDAIISEDDVTDPYMLFTEEVTLPNLEVLELRGINVQMIWQNQVVAMSCGVKNLTSLILRGCHNLRYIFSCSIASNFARLQHLEICNCQALQEIVVMDNEGDCVEFPSFKKLYMHGCPKLKQFMVKDKSKHDVKAIPLPFFNEKVALPKLEYLYLSNCNSLSCLFSSSAARSFALLQDVEIYKCLVLEVIFDMEGANSEDRHSAVVSQLSKLRIFYLPKLKHIWNKDPQKVVSFQNLKVMKIDGCDRLKDVFPASIANQGGAETINRFVFPRVETLELDNLPNLTTFFPGMYTVEWPALTELKVSDWEIVMNILTNKEGHPQILIGKVLPNFERLTVTGKDTAKIWQFPDDLICKFKCLQVQFNSSPAILSLDFLQRFQKRKMLKICGQYDIFEIQDENGMLTLITNFNACSELKHIWKKESNMDHLVHLEVLFCYNLINSLVPSSTSFRNLTTLYVRDCREVTNIVTSSTTKSLVQLREMTVGSCKMLTEIVAADEGDDGKDYEIVFSQLKNLSLSDLESLTSFCSANCILQFPSLEELIVENCPKMESFFGGELSTPKLQKVKKSRWSEEYWCWKGDINTTIKELHEESCRNRYDDEKGAENED